jgi:capsular exopolysaccharide synthesis family protein
MAPVYESSSKLLVRRPGKEAISVPPKGGVSLFRGVTREESTVDTGVEILTGRYLAEKVINEIGVKTIYPDIDGETFFGKLSELEKAILKFQKNLTVTEGNLIEVEFRHRDPSLAAKVVNKLIEDFLDYYLAIQKQGQKYDFFKKQADLIGKRLKDSQKEYGLFRNQHKISSIQKQKSLLLLQISDMEVEIARTRAEISEQESIAGGLKKPSSAVTEIQRKLIALKSKEKKLSQHVTQYKLELGRLDKAETRLRELERQVKMDEENYMLYTSKMEEARIASAMDEQKNINFSVIEPALPPITPIKPQKLFIITVAVILGCIGGGLLGFVSEYFTHTFDDRENIEKILNCTEIASFSELNKQEIDMSLQFKIPGKILEGCNQIKHYLTRTLPDKKNKTILFCSSKEGEGTSTVLFSFAISLASEGEKVLLVDANMRRPSLHSLFGVDRANGLSDVIVKESPVDNIPKNTQIENLTLITSGIPQSNPSVLLQYEYFDSFMREVETKADWVLFDSPPVNSYNDACVIASKVDGVTMVVKAGKTRWEVANSALNQIRQCNAKFLGAVLNMRKMYIPEWLYKML